MAAADLARGHRLALADLTWVRPGGGLPPGDEHRLIGRVLLRNVSFGERLAISDVVEPERASMLTPAASAR